MLLCLVLSLASFWGSGRTKRKKIGLPWPCMEHYLGFSDGFLLSVNFQAAADAFMEKPTTVKGPPGVSLLALRTRLLNAPLLVRVMLQLAYLIAKPPGPIKGIWRTARTCKVRQLTVYVSAGGEPVWLDLRH